MILTVEEAKTRRCQEGFGPGPMSPNGMTFVAMAGTCYAQATSPTCCIGPDCMAWCWAHHRTIDGVQLGFCGKVGG